MKKIWLLPFVLFTGSAYASCIQTENHYVTTVEETGRYELTTHRDAKLSSLNPLESDSEPVITEELVLEGDKTSEECLFDEKTQTLVLNYAFNKDNLTATHKQVLQQYIDILDKSLSIVVDGHADKAGSPKYNLALSKRRAGKVAAYLRDTLGQGKRIVERGFGESSPACSPKDNGKSGCNRRVVLTVK